MNTQKTSVKKNWTIVLYLSILFSLVLIGQDLFRELVFFGRDLDQFEDNLEDDLKISLKSDVEAKEELINYDLASIEETFPAHIKENLQGISHVIDEAYILTNNQLVEEEVVALISRHQEQDQTHVYQLISKDGDVLFSPIYEIGEDIQESKDAFGRSYYHDLMQSLEDEEEVFIDYYLQEGGRIWKYKAYAKNIKDQDFFLMTYAKEDTYKEKLKADLIEAIRQYGQESTGDIFVYEQNGQILLHKQTSFIGLDVLELNNPYLEKAKNVMDFVVSSSQAGFVTYDFENQEQNEVLHKIAYVTYIEELDLVLGSSIDDAYYASLVQTFQRESFNRIFYFKIPIYLVLIAIGGAIYYFVQANIKRSITLLKEEEKLYQRFADLTNEIILITNLKGQILFLNALGERTLCPEKKEKTMYLDALLKEEESYYIMHAPLQTYYVQFNVDNIYYHGEPSKLYLFQDITENIESLREIESVSTKDELTNLENRRSMNQDYRQKIVPYMRNGQTAYLAMIDLDYFKTVNDTYGHVYGDKVLKIIAQIMKENMEEDCKIYRIGGDEFALFARNMTKEALIKKLDTMRTMIEQYPYEKPIQVSFSAGIAMMHLSSEQKTIQDFYFEADNYLYQAKDQGKKKTIG